MQKNFKLSDLFRVLVWLFAKLAYAVAPVPMLFLFARLKGYARSFYSKDRFDVKKNLTSIFRHEKSAQEIQTLACQHFAHLSRLDLSKIWRKIQNFSGLEQCEVEGLEHLDAALRERKGVILLTAHYGYSRMIKHALRQRHYTVWIAGPLIPKDKSKKRTRFANWMFEEVLKLPEFSIMEENDFATTLNVRPLVQALSRNEILMLTADGLRSSNLIEGRILGERTAFATGSISLARGTGAVILPAFGVDSGKGLIGLKVCIEPALGLEWSDNPKEDLRTNLEKFIPVFETYIKRYPHLSRWTRRDFFKKRHKALAAEVEDRYAGHFKARKEVEPA